MESGEAGLAEERVRHALDRLGTDAASAPEVPAAVTTRIGAALRAARPPAAHAVTRTRPRLGRFQLIGVIIALCAAAAITVAALALMRTASTPRFPAGPTAERITVSVPLAPVDTPNAVVTRP